jgi:hypothetical protein
VRRWKMSAQNGRWKDRMSQSDLDAVDRGIPAIAPRGKGSHETLRWRQMDSNFRFPNRSAPVFEQAVPSPTIGLTVSRPGTEGSNPSPSRRESIANLTPADAEDRDGSGLRHAGLHGSYVRILAGSDVSGQLPPHASARISVGATSLVPYELSVCIL